jgi:hypothetical protein
MKANKLLGSVFTGIGVTFGSGIAAINGINNKRLSESLFQKATWKMSFSEKTVERFGSIVMFGVAIPIVKGTVYGLTWPISAPGCYYDYVNDMGTRHFVCHIFLNDDDKELLCIYNDVKLIGVS